MKYVKVGEKVNYEGTMLLVAISKDDKPICSGCFFSDRYRGRVGLARISCCVHDTKYGYASDDEKEWDSFCEMIYGTNLKK